MTEKWLTLGGVGYNFDQVQSAKQIENGKYKIVFKTGEELIFGQQDKRAKIMYYLENKEGKNGYNSYIGLEGINNAELKGSKDSACKLYARFCKNMNVDFSQNNKKDHVYLECSQNTILKTDNKDSMRGRITDSKAKYEVSDNIADFGCDVTKAGTYELKVPDVFIKREDVPEVLLKAYDKIAKLHNKKKSIDNYQEVAQFSKNVQNAFDSEQITKEQAVKMGFEPKSTYQYDKYTEKFGGAAADAVIKCSSKIDQKVFDGKGTTGSKVLDFCLGVATLTGVLGAGVSGAAVGLVVDGVRIPYDYATGEIDKQTNFTHWKVNRNWHPEPKEK